MVFGSHANTRAIYSTPPCPSLAASTAAYRRRSFSDSHQKNRCIVWSTSAVYTSMPHSLIRDLLCGKDTAAQAIREVIVDHVLKGCATCCAKVTASWLRATACPGEPRYHSVHAAQLGHSTPSSSP